MDFETQDTELLSDASLPPSLCTRCWDCDAATARPGDGRSLHFGLQQAKIAVANTGCMLRSTILNSLFSFYFLLFSLCLPIVCFIIHLFVLCLMIFALSGRLVILSSHLRRICNTVSQLDIICLT